MKVINHLLALPSVVAAFVFAQDPSSWAVSTLLFSGILIVMLIAGVLPRLASMWPTSLVTLLLFAATLAATNLTWSQNVWVWAFQVALSGLPVLSVVLLETISVWPGVSRPTTRGIRFLAFLLVLLWWAVVMPTVEGWLSEEGDPLIFEAVLFLVSARSIVISVTSVRTARRLIPLFRPVLMAIAVALVTQIYGLWLVAPVQTVPAPTPMALAHEVRREFAAMYPRWKSDPQRLDGFWAKYRHELATASLNCAEDDEPCFEMLRVLRRLFAEFRNGHTEVFIPSELGLPPFRLLRTDDGVGIDWVESGSVAAKLGLTSGQRVVAIDGVPVEEAVKRVAPWEIAYAAPHKREHAAYGQLVKGLPGTVVALTIETPDGVKRTVHVEREPMLAEWERQQAEKYEPELEWFLDADGIGEIWIGSFGGPTTVERFDHAMSQMEGTTSLILDLRGNHGGYVHSAIEVLGHFVHEPTILGEDCVLLSWEDGPNFECIPRWVYPSPRPYAGQLAVLIDESVVSAAEVVAYGLCRMGEARCFGHPTAGETDCVVHRDVPGAVVAIPSADFRPAVGEPIQGIGLEPDVRVRLTLEDLREERDPFFEAARGWLLSDTRADRTER